MWNRSEVTRVFLEWFRFGLFMKAEWRPDGLSGEEKEGYWKENVRLVEGLLEKYGSPHGASYLDATAPQEESGRHYSVVSQHINGVVQWS